MLTTAGLRVGHLETADRGPCCREWGHNNNVTNRDSILPRISIKRPYRGARISETASPPRSLLPEIYLFSPQLGPSCLPNVAPPIILTVLFILSNLIIPELEKFLFFDLRLLFEENSVAVYNRSIFLFFSPRS